MVPATNEHRQYIFGEFTLDLDRCVLLYESKEIALRPKSFDVLHYLLKNSQRVVPRDEILNEVWPDVFVIDDSLTQCLFDIRKALGENGKHIVRTVPRRGYVFDLPVTYIDSVESEQTSSVEILLSARRPSRWIMVALTLLTLTLIFSWWRSEFRRPPIAEEIANSQSPIAESIAVLPFIDMSESGNHEYLADGMAEEILNLLSKEDGLTVIARTSSFSFKGQNVDIATIAHHLNVAHVLEGSVRTAGDQLRITAQLIDAKTGTHIWSDTYDKIFSVDNLLEIQSSIAREIVAILSTKILFDAVPQGKRQRPSNMTALNEYLNGLLFLRRIEIGQPEGNLAFESAIEKFSASIKADPVWAPSHVALARVYHFWKDDRNTLRIAKQHVLEGIRLDIEYAPAYESLGYILHQQRDFVGAEQAYRQARNLDYDLGWGWALLLSSLARFDEAIEEFQKAIVRNPMSRIIRRQYAYNLIHAERYVEALAAFEELISAYPGDTYVRMGWVETKLRLGHHAEAMPWLEKWGTADVISQDRYPIYLAELFALAGSYDRIIALLGNTNPNFHIGVASQAWMALVLGEQERALHLLELAATDAPEQLLYIRATPEIRALAGNRRYENILDEIGFPR